MAFFQSVQDSGTPIINFGQNAWTRRVLAPISIFCWAYSTVDITTIANAGVLVANMNNVEACAGWGSIAFEADGVGTNRNMAVQMASWERRAPRRMGNGNSIPRKTRMSGTAISSLTAMRTSPM